MPAAPDDPEDLPPPPRVRRDWGLLVGWVLALGVLILVGYGFVESPLVDPFGNSQQFLRLLRAILVVPLILLLTVLLVTRSRRAEWIDGRARLLLDLAPATLLLLDDHGLVRRTHPAGAPVLGRSVGAVRGRALTELVAPASRGEFADLIAAAHRSSGTVSRELRGVRRDGSEVGIELHLRRGNVLGRPMTAVYLRDLSEREQLVDALASRAAELARSNRDLEQFAYVASHDLQEPIRMVGSFTELLHQRYGTTLNAEATEFLQFARQGATRMRELVDALLAYSRIDRRGEPFERVALDPIVDAALLNLREAVRSSGATIDRTPLPEVDGDATQLRQLFQNLLANAIKFRGPAPPRITIRSVPDGPGWRISVADDGIGIPPEAHERIFAIFQRLHTREEYEGSGIGLAVCKRVVERHGGRIWVESSGRPGEGATFQFTLPAPGKGPAPPPVAVPAGELAVRREAQSLIEDRLKALV